MKVFLNVSFIVIGVVIASIGEIKFVFIGFLFQLGGICFEAIRLVMVERLLSSAEYKMDPLVSLYYFAPVCAVMNFCVSIVFEIPHMSLAEVYNVGLFTLLANAMIAFALNVSVVFLVRSRLPLLRPFLLVIANFSLDRPHVLSHHDALWRPQRCSPCHGFHRHLGHPCLRSTVFRLQHCARGPYVLQTRC